MNVPPNNGCKPKENNDSTDKANSKEKNDSAPSTTADVMVDIPLSRRYVELKLNNSLSQEELEQNRQYTTTLENLMQKFVCSHDFCFAIKTSQDRHSIEAGDASVKADNAMKLCFDLEDSRRYTFANIVEELALASIEMAEQVKARVQDQFSRLINFIPNKRNMNGPEEQSANNSLKQAIIRLYKARTEN